MKGRDPEGLRRLRTYQAYKDSGIDWLGDVPASWEVKRIRHIVRSIEQGWSPECDNRQADEGEWGVLKAGCVNRGLFIEAEHKALPSSLDPIPELEIAEGDLLMSRASGSPELVGSVAVVSKCRPRLLLCDKLFRLHLSTGSADRRFLAFAMNSRLARWQIERVLSGGSGLANNIAQKVVKDLIVSLPPLSDQVAITTFLDRETARIDALVAKNERLIELLQEKRTALITRAVTKGLDPNVPMKNSGVEWLGETPAHWEVKRVKRLCLVRRGASPRPIDDPIYFDDDGDYAWVRIADVTASERYLETTTQRLSALGRSKSVALEPGELFVSIAATVGKPIITKIRCCVHDGFVYFVGLNENREFLYYVFSCGEPYKGLGKLGTQLNLNTNTIGDIQLPLPPCEEQRAIVHLLDRETAKIDALITKVRDAIAHLNELRTALISAAVTGKIVVSEEAT